MKTLKTLTNIDKELEDFSESLVKSNKKNIGVVVCNKCNFKFWSVSISKDFSIAKFVCCNDLVKFSIPITIPSNYSTENIIITKNEHKCNPVFLTVCIAAGYMNGLDIFEKFLITSKCKTCKEIFVLFSYEILGMNQF